MMPSIPSSIKGATLSKGQIERLTFIAKAISSVNPGRSAEANLNQSIGSFLMTAVKRGLKWEDKPYFRIGNGDGPVVVPSWARPDG